MAERHKHADLIIAWANGAKIQSKSSLADSEWNDCAAPRWFEDVEYRIKPKPKVKKWRVVFKRVIDGELMVSGGCFKSLAEFDMLYGKSFSAIELIKATEIEV